MKRKDVLSSLVFTAGLIGAVVVSQNQPDIANLLTKFLPVTQSLLISNVMPSCIAAVGILGSNVFNRKNFFGSLVAFFTTAYLVNEVFNLSKRFSDQQLVNIKDMWLDDGKDIVHETLAKHEPMLKNLPARQLPLLFAALPLIAGVVAEGCKNLFSKLLPSKAAVSDERRVGSALPLLGGAVSNLVFPEVTPQRPRATSRSNTTGSGGSGLASGHISGGHADKVVRRRLSEAERLIRDQGELKR